MHIMQRRDSFWKQGYAYMINIKAVTLFSLKVLHILYERIITL